MSLVEAWCSCKGPSRAAVTRVVCWAVLGLGCCLPALADPPRPGKRAPLDASLAVLDPSGDVNCIIAIHLGEIFSTPGMAKQAAVINSILATQLEPLFGLPINLPVKVEDIDQIVLRFYLTIDLKPKQKLYFCGGLTAVRMKEPFDRDGWIKTNLPKARKVEKDGAAWYELAGLAATEDKSPVTFKFCVADERTILLDSLTINKRIEARKKHEKADWFSEWKEVEGGLAAALIIDPEHRYSAKGIKATMPANLGVKDKELAEVELAVARTASRVVIGLDGDKGIRLTARFTCDAPDGAVDLEKAFAIFGKRVRASLPEDPESRVRCTLQRSGKRVIVTATAKVGLERLIEMLAREASVSVPEKYDPAPPAPPTP
jgi:hypothetical protein